MRSTMSEDQLREALLETGVLNVTQVRVVEDYQRTVGGAFEDVVVRLGFATEEQLRGLSAAQGRLCVTPGLVARPLLNRVPHRLLRGYRVVPVEHEGAIVLAAEGDAIEPIIQEELWGLLGTQLPVVQARAGSVTATLDTLADERGAEAAGEGRRVSSDTQRVPEEAPGAPSPEISVEELVALLVRKGVITENDLLEAAGAGSGRVRASAP